MDKFSIHPDRYEPGYFFPTCHDSNGQTLWVGIGGDSVEGCTEQIQRVRVRFDAQKEIVRAW